MCCCLVLLKFISCCLLDIEDQVIGTTPLNQKLHLLPVVLLISVPDETHHGCVVCILQDVVVFKPGMAVVGHQGEEEWAEDVVLRRASAE